MVQYFLLYNYDNNFKKETIYQNKIHFSIVLFKISIKMQISNVEQNWFQNILSFIN